MKNETVESKLWRRCRVATAKNNWNHPEQDNAFFIADTYGFARVLLDGETETQTFAWGWVTFDVRADWRKVFG